MTETNAYQQHLQTGMKWHSHTSVFLAGKPKFSQIKMAEDVKGPMVLRGSWYPQRCVSLSHPGLLKNHVENWMKNMKCLYFRAHQRPLWNQRVRIPEVCKFSGSHFPCWLKYTVNPTLWIIFPHSNTNQHIVHPNSQTFTFISQELQSEGKIHHTPLLI